MALFVLLGFGIVSSAVTSCVLLLANVSFAVFFVVFKVIKYPPLNVSLVVFVYK